MRLYLATGDSVAIATHCQSGWTLEEGAADSGALCLVVDPHAPNLNYAATMGTACCAERTAAAPGRRPRSSPPPEEGDVREGDGKGT